MDLPPEPEPTPQPRPRRSNRLALIGGAVALVAGLAIAGGLILSGRGEKAPPPPASQAGLIIEAGEEPGKIDPAKPLRCFVAGQFSGEFSLAECARRNGVATDALDVGIDETGALAAAQEAGMTLTPLPPADQASETADPGPPPEAADVEPAPAAAASGGAACWRHNRGRWTRLPGDFDLNGCVQQLYAGRCARPGSAEYGRWGQQTLRLVTGKVEASADNQTFRTLVSQGSTCVIPPLG